MLPARTKPYLNRLGHLAVGLTLFTFFLLIFFNRFLPITDAWFHHDALRMLREGKFPYRDFYYFTQPMALLMTETALRFSDQLIFVRYYGFAERLVLFIALYALLSRHFSSRATFFGTVATMFLFQTSNYDGFFMYYTTSMLFFLCALLCLQHVYLKPDTRWRNLLIFVAGVLSSLSFFTKQSTGLFATAALFFSLAILARNKRDAAMGPLIFSVAWCLASAPWIVWLNANHAWNDYVRQVFIGAKSSKGPLFNILFSFLRRAITPWSIFISGIIVVYLHGVSRVGRLKYTTKVEEERPLSLAYSVWALFGLMIVPLLIPGFLYDIYFDTGYGTAETLIAHLSFYCVTAAFLRIMYLRFFGGWKKRDPDRDALAMVAIACFFWMYSTGLSFSVEAQSLLPTLGFGLAFIYDRVVITHTRAIKNAVIAVCCWIFFLSACHKYYMVYWWVGWREHILHPSTSSRQPKLAGYYLRPEVQEEFDQVVERIERYTGPNDTIFVFPHMPMFYYLTNRNHVTFCSVHYWDVCPDEYARRDAQLLRENPPKAFLYMQMPSRDWGYYEKAFRGNKKSGQIEIKQLLEQFMKGERYREDYQFVSQGHHYPISLWVEKSGPEAGKNQRK